MNFATHRTRMVAHFIWLEQQNLRYAKDALAVYQLHPDCPCPDILTSIKAEKARRQLLSSSVDRPSK